MATDSGEFTRDSAERIAQATQWVEQQREETVLDRRFRRGHIPTGAALAFAKADIAAGASGTVYMAEGEPLSETASTEERTVYNSMLGTVTQDSLCVIQIPAVLECGTGANWHIVGVGSETTFHADWLEVTLGQDIIDNETNVSYSTPNVVSPKGASATVPTIDKIYNTQRNLVASNGDNAIVLYDKNSSTVAGEEVWEVMGVDSIRLPIATMIAAGPQTLTAGAAAVALAFTSNVNDDPTGFADAANNRFVLPTRDGWFLLRCSFEAEADDSSSSALVHTATLSFNVVGAGARSFTQDLIGNTAGAIRQTVSHEHPFTSGGGSNVSFTVQETLGSNNIDIYNVVAECFYLPTW